MEKRMIKKNKDASASLQVRRTKHAVRQSVEMTFARYDYSALEKRIRYVITYLAFQESVGRAGEETLLGRVDMDEYHQRYATIPIRILMGASRSHNYDDVRAAVDSFNTKTVWLSDGEGGWFKAYPLVAAYVRKSRGNVILKIDRAVWKTFARESRHYTEYDIMQAIQFRSPLTMRLYEIANTLTGPGEFSISYLKDIFCHGGPDSDNGQFLRDLRHAAAELEKSDVGLEIDVIKEKPSSRRITALRMTPKLICQGRIREEAVRRTLRSHGVSWLLTPVDRKALSGAGFSEEDVCRNIVLFKGAQSVLNGRGCHPTAFAEKVSELYGKSLSKENPRGWIIAALKEIVDGA
jgi:hypothetical protein